jgi:hypothetical protein
LTDAGSSTDLVDGEWQELSAGDVPAPPVQVVVSLEA